MRAPSNNPITLPFGSSDPPYSTANRHKGVDFGWQTARGGTDLTNRAPFDGTVTCVPNNGDDGNGIYMRDLSGNLHGLLHNASFLVANGSRVQEGQAIGVMGQTGKADGIHLHWCTKNTAGTFFNPLTLLPAGMGAEQAQELSMTTNQATALLDELFWEFTGRKVKDSEQAEYVPMLLADQYKQVLTKIAAFPETEAYVARERLSAVTQELQVLQSQLTDAQAKAQIEKVIERCTVNLSDMPADDASLLTKIVAFFTRKK